MKKLALVGSGIKSISHFTTEFKTYTSNADKVLYLVNEPITKEWIKNHSKLSESLDSIYFSETDRQFAYDKIKNKILDELCIYDFITVVIYGHPTIFADPGLQAVIEAQKQSIETLILPGISIENCLYADLRIDPGQFGCLHVEATELLLYDKIIDPTSHLCVWQIGMIGNRSANQTNKKSKHLDLLRFKLQNYYPEHHALFLYEASVYPTVEPQIHQFLLAEIESQSISTLSTLYIPPLPQRQVNQEILNKLYLENGI
ncbi:TPA: methylase [Legionella pneumophila]|uniref:Methylase n=1 Tax=Legionella pneumophila TaxID=446 RepID=A0AAN5R5I2_LEGPN|nr:SAM-dependent methyltransferase [Legionella pneumophila subsp. fraseri]HAT1596724.1 methylase [Legionella pneumophila]MDW9035449.1 SAM-dependent methyltransferase [Legionella pneumophila subsp. fraseri]MDW9038510.1 SAM-dependent methyltransferase [Legionella pneumophila subsp. fraseri]MDW9041571.1 SAM-dependent methyltransferase [Legionella pneumophila subsp. fraseri]